MWRQGRKEAAASRQAEYCRCSTEVLMVPRGAAARRR